MAFSQIKRSRFKRDDRYIGEQQETSETREIGRKIRNTGNTYERKVCKK